MGNMTALISAFARAWHTEHHADAPVFSDPYARKLITDTEYATIAKSMAEGIAFFAPDFEGTDEEALRLIVDTQLSPQVLGRSAFAARAAENAYRIGCRQFVFLACGLDTFALTTRRRHLEVFDLDLPEAIEDRVARIEHAGLDFSCQAREVACDLADPVWTASLVDAGFDRDKRAFVTLLGITYYLTEDEMRGLARALAAVLCPGSAICLDYPHVEGGDHSSRTRELAQAAGEPMKATYGAPEIEALLGEEGFLTYEHLNAQAATAELFFDHNRTYPEHAMAAPAGVGYLLAVKQ